MPALTMADLQIHVTFSGRSGVVPIGRDHIQLRGNLAAEFDLLAIDIAGFARGGSIYPLTYIARAPRDFFLSTRERALELVVLGPHHRAAPAFAEHKERQNDPIITFALSNAGKPVIFTRKQLELLSFVRKKTGLGRISLEDLRAKFEKYSAKTGLTKKGFDMLMREIIPAQSLSESEKMQLAKALSRIFHAFDRNDDGIAEGSDLLTALGMLVSSKGLAFAFRLADANGDGFVSPSEFMVFTRAFLTLVLALNDDIAEFSAEYVTSLIDSTTDSVVRQAFNEADMNRDGLLTWSEFSLWYKNGGHLVMPWVSLLQSRPDSVGHDEQEGEAKAYADDPNEIVYEFALAPTYGNLVITRTDVDNLENVLLATELYNKDAELVMEFFCTRADDQDMLTKEAFDECIRALAPEVASMRREDRNRISYVLNNIFFAFDRSAIRKVRIDEFCTGFSLLCAGSKSTKLQLAFSLFDAEAKGSLKPFDFARFLRSVLTVLFAMNDAAASLTSFQVYEAIDKTTARATRLMLGNLGQSNGGQAVQSISFEDFANFYNTQSGNETISFVELLDLSKFPFQELELESKSRRGRKYSKNDNKVVFSFDMMPVPHRLDVKRKHSKRLQKVLDASGISVVTPDLLHTAIANASSHGRTLSKTDYEQILLDFDLEYGPGDEEEDDPQLVSYFFNSLFYAYDRDGANEEVNSSEISCGLSVLCAGKKSDKLAYGFSAFDSDQDGTLTSEELARFLRSFITALFVLVQEEDDDQQDPESIWQTVDTTSLHLAADVVHSLGGANRVSFEEFAQWYGKSGYQTASFLELLDLTKWPAIEEDEEEPEDGDNGEEAAEDEVVTSDLPVYVFALTRKHTLEVHERDIEFVRRLVEASGLNQVGCEELVYALVSRADEQRSLSEEAFLQSLGLIVNNRGNDREFALDTLTSLYEVCDREGLGCDYRDLLGLLFLCGGSKSTKLAHSWNAISSSKDGDLDRTELFLLMRAFLAALHTFNYGAHSNSMNDIHHNIDDAANVLAANIFLAARRKKKDTLSFEEFAEFYSEGGGYRLAPWLELLNLGKFIGAEYDSARPHGHTRHGQQLANGVKQSKELKTITATNQDDSRVIFSFKITEDNDSLIVTQKDVMLLRSVLDQSRIGSMDSETVVRLLTEQVNEEGQLSEQGFGTFVGTHVLKNEDNAQDDFVASALYQMFSAFDTNGEGSVDPRAFAVALSLLGSGSKSSKLSLGWALFSRQDEDDSDVGVGPMTRSMLIDFFVTLLIAISSFAGNCLSDTVISLAANEAADKVFEDVGGDEISFDGFASWYTGQGFEHLSWIELLANTKWRLPQ